MDPDRRYPEGIRGGKGKKINVGGAPYYAEVC